MKCQTPEFWFFYKQTAGSHDIQNELHLQGGCVKIDSENSTRFYFGREEGVKMKKRVVYVLLCFMLCMASIPAAVFADSETPAVPATKWSDNAATAFAGGSGTEADPYQIETPEQLAKLAADVNSGVVGQTHIREYFKLTKDIDLSAHRWIPIGRGTVLKPYQAFSGYFNGNDKTITGMYVDESTEKYSAGLFGNFSGYEIKNLKIKDAYVKTSSDVNEQSGNRDAAGILIGSAIQGHEMTISVKDCSVSGIVESDSARTGGLAGYNSYGTYENCTADVKVKGAGKAGGFVGEDFSGTYKNCTAEGNVSGSWSVGGFAGILFFESKADHCAAQGKVTASDWNAGGFAGYVENGVTISNCVAAGDVESTVDGWEPKVGGFAGTVTGANTVSNSHAAGKVTSASKDIKAGGFAGALVETNNFASCSFDVEKNADLKAAGGTEAAEIEGVEAASTQKVKANVCRDYYGKHELKEVPGKAANCLEDGVETYWMCDNCGSMYSDKEQMTMITEPAVIKATGHKFGEWKVIKEATASEKGEKQRTCQVCQFVEKAEIPAAGAPVNDKSAATGDSSMPILYGILALAALAGAGAVIVTRKKRMN